MVALQQNHETAATSCFHVYCKTDEYSYKTNEFNCKRDEFNSKNLYLSFVIYRDRGIVFVEDTVYASVFEKEG